MLGTGSFIVSKPDYLMFEGLFSFVTTQIKL